MTLKSPKLILGSLIPPSVPPAPRQLNHLSVQQGSQRGVSKNSAQLLPQESLRSLRNHGRKMSRKQTSDRDQKEPCQICSLAVPGTQEAALPQGVEPCWPHARFLVEAEALMPWSGRWRTARPWSCPLASGSHPPVSDGLLVSVGGWEFPHPPPSPSHFGPKGAEKTTITIQKVPPRTLDWRMWACGRS